MHGPRMTFTTSGALLRLHPQDNVLVAKAALALGQELPGLGVRVRAQVPPGHKVAACRIAVVVGARHLTQAPAKPGRVEL